MGKLDWPIGVNVVVERRFLHIFLGSGFSPDTAASELDPPPRESVHFAQFMLVYFFLSNVLCFQCLLLIVLMLQHIAQIRIFLTPQGEGGGAPVGRISLFFGYFLGKISGSPPVLKSPSCCIHVKFGVSGARKGFWLFSGNHLW